MTIDPDYLIERKYHKTQLRKWKFISVVAFIILITLFILRMQGYKHNIIGSRAEDYIALMRIEDIIIEDKKRDQRLIDLKNDDKVKALVIYIDSPGGTIVGSERAYKLIRSIAESKPVISVLGTVATSGGYMVAIASDYIISHRGTMTGSIGVVMQTPEITDLIEKIGVKFNSFKSGELKASPNPFEKVTPKVREAIMSTVEDMYSFFVDLVVDRRGLSQEVVLKIADGRVYSGKQALDLKLVDQLGTLEDAVIWLREEKKIDNDLKMVDITVKPTTSVLEILMNNMHEILFSKISGLYKSITFRF